MKLDGLSQSLLGSSTVLILLVEIEPKSMQSSLIYSLCGMILATLSLDDTPTGPASEPAFTASFHLPDQQLATLLSWFQGSRYKSPAAALAAYRSKTQQPEVVPRGIQAIISILNPEMVRELEVLDGATFEISNTGGVSSDWSLVIPKDDEAIRTLATALAQHDGQELQPSDRLPTSLYQLGPPGSPFLTRFDGRTALGSDPESLRKLLDRPLKPHPAKNSVILFHVATKGLLFVKPNALSRIGMALEAVKFSTVSGSSLLNENGWLLETHTLLLDPNQANQLPTVNLLLTQVRENLPADVVFEFAFGLDRDGRTIEAIHRLGEEIIRALGSLRGEMPLRTRANLVANLLGFFPEVELWPRIDGIGGWVSTQGKEFTAAHLVLHTIEPGFTNPLAKRLIKTLQQLVQKDGSPKPKTELDLDLDFPEQPLVLGKLLGRRLSICIRTQNIFLTLGEPKPAGPTALTEEKITQGADQAPGANRSLKFWPGRLVATQGLSKEVARSLSEAPPVVWTGRRDGSELIDHVHWSPLPPTIRTLVDTLDLDRQNSEP